MPSLSHAHAGGGVRSAALTAIAMLAFAGNSVICRLALRDTAIDPASFTSLRILAGAVTLALIAAVSRRGRGGQRHGGAVPALALAAYAACFSFAYLSLSAATGALVLFGLVQATMLAAALVAGERPALAEWAGWLAAAAGLGWLLLPGADAPSPAGAVAMGCAGIAWGVYSMLGRRETDPLRATARNFALAAVPAVLLSLLTLGELSLPARGAWLALISGSVTSGLGYVVWYAALPGLSGLQAALVQLSVPAIAAAGGMLVLGEPLSARVLVSGALILGGIGVAIAGRARPAAVPDGR